MSSHLNVSSFPGGAPATPPQTGPLPRDYGVTRLVLLPRDPRWLHAYWEIAPYTWEEARRNFGEAVSRGRAVLRVHADHDGDKITFDVDIALDSRQWYVEAPRGGGQWRAELGLVLADGRFVLLAVSNTVDMPAGAVSDRIDDRWGVLRSLWDQLFELSGGGRVGVGSIDMAKALAQRWELLRGGSSGLAGSPTSWGKAPEQKKGFWLVADCEVTVYGATEPGAQVTFQGKPVALNPDGTFSFRFAFPDGALDFPIRATNADGDLTRGVSFHVTRASQKDPA